MNYLNSETTFTIIIQLISPFVKEKFQAIGLLSDVKMRNKMNRIILHCDMNNCFASIECLLNPSLKGLPIAVCGSKEERHGIVLAKSEQAKKYGVSTGEAIWQALQKCPDLKIVEPHYSEYAYYSKAARDIYSQYTDLVEPFGMDECWLDVTGSTKLFGDGPQIAEILRNRIKSEIGLTISIGVSFNKIFAKLGSDMKKPDAITVIPENFGPVIRHLPAADLFGVGRSSKKRLDAYCIHTIGDIADSSPSFLSSVFGKTGLILWQYANGLDTSPVMPLNYVSPIKSVGHGTTPPEDITNNNDMRIMLIRLSQDVSKRLRENHLVARGVSITMRDCTLVTTQAQTKLKFPTSCASELARSGYLLFMKKYNWEKPIRSVTITAIDLLSEHLPLQLDFEETYKTHIKRDKIEHAVDEIRNKYGTHIIAPASLIGSYYEDNVIPAFSSPK